MRSGFLDFFALAQETRGDVNRNPALSLTLNSILKTERDHNALRLR